MPLVHHTASQFFLQRIAQLSQRVADLEGQQNWGIRDGNMKLRIRAGLQPDSSFGIQILDDTGHVRVSLGDLPDGDYGLSVSDPGTGQSAEIMPTLTATHGDPAFSPTAATTWQTLGGPGVTVNVGNSGRVRVHLFAHMLNETKNLAYVGVAVDGTMPVAPGDLGFWGIGTSAGGGGSLAAAHVVSGLSAGDHTFKTVFQATATSSQAWTVVIEATAF